MSVVIEILKKLKSVHIGLLILGVIAVIYFIFRVDQSKINHLKSGGVLACGLEAKTEIIDEGYRLSKTGLAILSKSGKKWKLKECTPFPTQKHKRKK